MSSPYLISHDIGSLAKPSWRVKPFSKNPLSDFDIEQARKWGEKLNIVNYEHLLSLLSKRENFSQEEKKEIARWSSNYGLTFLDEAGMDLLWDGEQQRVEMYEYAVRKIKGFHFHGHVRSFDNKYYLKASAIGVPGISEPYHTREYHEYIEYTDKPLKVPITGAYTLVDWSYDEHYSSAIIPGESSIARTRKEARKQFLRDIAKNVIYPNLKALVNLGAQYLQIDEPAATTKHSEIAEFIQATKDSIGDLAGRAFFVIHICFSDYYLLFPQIQELEGIVDEIHLEYANRDTREPGTSKEQRTGFEILEKLKPTKFKVGLGLLDVHTDFIEPPELIRDRILFANEIIQDPARILVSPDCGLRTRTWEVAFQKLQNLIAGRNMALKELGLQVST